jgi:hypothetical protein
MQQFLGSTNSYCGKNSANRGLSCIEKRREHSAVLKLCQLLSSARCNRSRSRLHRKVSRTFSSSQALQTSIAMPRGKTQPIEVERCMRSKNSPQFLGFADSHRQQRCSRSRSRPHRESFEDVLPLWSYAEKRLQFLSIAEKRQEH